MFWFFLCLENDFGIVEGVVLTVVWLEVDGSDLVILTCDYVLYGYMCVVEAV